MRHAATLIAFCVLLSTISCSPHIELQLVNNTGEPVRLFVQWHSGEIDEYDINQSSAVTIMGWPAVQWRVLTRDREWSYKPPSLAVDDPFRHKLPFPRMGVRCVAQLESDGRVYLLAVHQKPVVSSFETQPNLFPVVPLPSAPAAQQGVERGREIARFK
jgi:hypothetical protein